MINPTYQQIIDRSANILGWIVYGEKVKFVKYTGITNKSVVDILNELKKTKNDT